MNSARFRFQRILLALTVLAFTPKLAPAQVDLGNYTATGSVEAGGFLQPVPATNVAKFREYQDLAQQLIAPELKLLLHDKEDRVFANFQALNVAQTNEMYDLHFGEYGLLDVDAQWQEIPHFLSDDIAKSPYQQNGGNFTLPSRPSAPAPATPVGSNIGTWLNGTAQPLSLSLLEGIANLNIRYTPTPKWTYSAYFNFQNQSGNSPYGEVFGPNPGTYSINELSQPIEYDTYNYGVGAQYADGTWLFGLQYEGSFFKNQDSTLTWQNPNTWGEMTGPDGSCVNSATFSGGGTAGVGPCNGRDFTYPDNEAHTFTATAGLNLPMDTHVMGSLSYGWWLQNQGFIPFTINSALPFQALPRQSLGGDVSPLFANISVVSRPINGLRLKATYSYFDYDNHDPAVAFADVNTLNDVADKWSATAFPFSFSTQTIQGEASYNLIQTLVASLAGNINTYHNGGMMVLQQDMTSYGPVVDWTPRDWLEFRGSYQYAFRDSPGYDNNRASLVARNGGATELDDLRRFDEATVHVNQFSLYADAEPFQAAEGKPWLKGNAWLETMTLYAEMDYDNYSYPSSDFGLQHWSDYTPSLGMNWNPLKDLNVFADWSWTATDWGLRSLDRTSSATVGPWTSYGREQGNSIDFGFDSAIPAFWILRHPSHLKVQYTYTVTNDLTHANGSSATGAVDYPDVGSRFHELIVNYSYRFRKNMALNIGYYFSNFGENDFGYDQFQPWEASSPQSVFLGNSTWTPYTANTAYMTLQFKF